MPRLPLTSDALLDAEHRPYFLWWLDCSVGELAQHLASADPERKTYYLGALLREANARRLAVHHARASARFMAQGRTASGAE
jgi:hypothetical protein